MVFHMLLLVQLRMHPVYYKQQAQYLLLIDLTELLRRWIESYCRFQKQTLQYLSCKRPSSKFNTCSFFYTSDNKCFFALLFKEIKHVWNWPRTVIDFYT